MTIHAAWTNPQVDRARVLANHIAAGLAHVTIRSNAADRRPSRHGPGVRS